MQKLTEIKANLSLHFPLIAKMPHKVQFFKKKIFEIYLLKAHRWKVVEVEKNGHNRIGIYRISSKVDN